MSNLSYDSRLPSKYDYSGNHAEILNFITQHNLHDFLEGFYPGVIVAGYDVYHIVLELEENTLQVIIYSGATFTNSCLSNIEKHLIPAKLMKFINLSSIRD